MIKHETFLDLIYFIKTSLSDSKAVIGISGGKDSTVVAGLCVEALGKDNVYGVLMPNGEQSDIQDSIDVCNILGIQYEIVNINSIYKMMTDSINTDISEQASRNILPRIRMTVLYAIAQSINGRVINTSNASEAYVGWTTKWGDNTGDLFPILNFTKTEVEELGDHLNLPSRLVHKVPADGLTGSSDEENLGFTYKELDEYIRGINKEPDHLNKILERHQGSEHKRNPFKTFIS